MLLRLIPEQVTKRWKIIRYALEQCLPEVSKVGEDTIANILKALIAEEAYCWISVGSDEHLYVVFFTTFLDAPFTRRRDMLMYGMYAFRPTPMELWQESLDKFKIFAKSKGCFSLVTYATDQKVIEIAEKVGIDVKTRFLTMEV